MMNNPYHISKSLETIFWVKLRKFFDADPGSVDGKNLDPGSGINIPDPQLGNLDAGVRWSSKSVTLLLSIL